MLFRTARATLTLAAWLIIIGPSVADAEAPQFLLSSSQKAVQLWRAMAENDLEFAKMTLRAHYIYAIYPQPEVPQSTFDEAERRAASDLPNVKDFGSYRALLLHYISTFQDPHLRVVFRLEPTSVQWPGFAAAYRGGKFVIDRSQLADVVDGVTLESCDGHLIEDLIDDRIAFEGGVKGLEATRATLARTLFVDWGSPSYPRIKSCRIAGRTVDLAWHSIPTSGLLTIDGAGSSQREPLLSMRPFGADGTWVRIGTMSPDPSQAKQFRDLIDRAPSLRDRSTIVIDVRGNPGGSYNWFMAFLRGLYGDEATAYYARERLFLRNIAIADNQDDLGPPASPKAGPSDAASQEQPPPPDIIDTTVANPKLVNTPTGRIAVLSQVPLDQRNPPTGSPPPMLVKAKVLVLTDYGCASACLSFLDEIGDFPGVTRIGVATYVDRRSGSPKPFALPSGNAIITVPFLFREFRRRGDNVPLLPAYKFDGDIGDTNAVQNWIRSTVVPSLDRH